MPWSPRQLVVPLLFLATLAAPWDWGGPGCVITAEAGGFVAVHDVEQALKSWDTHLWLDPPPQVTRALGARAAAVGWLALLGWVVCGLVPTPRARALATRAGPLAAGAVAAQLLLHDVGGQAGLALAATCWIWGASAVALWVQRQQVRPAVSLAVAVGCLGMARLVHADGTYLFGGSLAAVLLAATVLRATRGVRADDAVPEASASESAG